MKFSVAKSAGLKKALLAAAGIGTAVQYSVPSGDHTDGHARPFDLPHPQEGVESAVGFGVKVAALVRSVHKVWSQREVEHGGGSGSGGVHSMATTMLIDLLAAVTEDPDIVDNRSSRLAASRVVRWLLAAAAESPAGSAERGGMVRYLLAALQHPDAAAALLGHSGASSLLLALSAASPPLQAALAAALQRCYSSPALASIQQATLEDVAAAVRAAALLQHPAPQRLAALRMLRVWGDASEANCALLAEAGAGPVLADCAAASSGAADGELQVEVVGLMAVLARDCPARMTRPLCLRAWLYQLLCITADAAGAGDWPLAESALAAFGSCLRRGVELPEGLMHGAALPLLRRLAAATDVEAGRASARLTAAVDVSHDPAGDGAAEAQLQPKQRWWGYSSLLARISGGGGQPSGPHARNDGDAARDAGRVRVAVAGVIAALAEGAGVVLPVEERMEWTERMLAWLPAPGPTLRHAAAEAAAAEDSASLSGPTPTSDNQAQPSTGGDGDGEAAAAVVAALAALAAAPGPPGLHAALVWLAELLMQLSRQVEADNAAQGKRAAARKRLAAAAPSAAKGWASSAVSSLSLQSGDGGKGSWWAASGAGPLPAEPAVRRAAPEQVLAAAAATAAAEVRAATEEAAEAQQEVMAEAEAAAVALGSAAAAIAPSSSSSSSWLWHYIPWPWGSSDEQQSSGGQQQQPPSDSELSLYLDAAPVGPSYVRSVAASLLEASGRLGTYAEPPADAEDALSPLALAAYPAAAAAVDAEVAGKVACQALKVLCSLAAERDSRRAWLLEVGTLRLMRRLVVERSAEVAPMQQQSEAAPVGPGQQRQTPNAGLQPEAEGAKKEVHAAAAALPIRRQVARLLAILSSSDAGAAAVAEGGWVPWLQRLALSSDCKVSSSAARALLHLESAAAARRNSGGKQAGGAAEPLLPLTSASLPADEPAAAGLGAAAGASSGGDGSPPTPPGLAALPALGAAAEGALHEAADQLHGALAQLRHALDWRLDATRPPVPPESRLVIPDGVHLFEPLAQHHVALARRGTPDRSEAAPTMDVVFVHGIRGGAFVTWRREGALGRGAASEALTQSVCWPTAWLAPALPTARLLSAEYAAPATAWEGRSLPLHQTADQLAEKLAAAGVGQRPVVFVAHSMGGLLVKDILARGRGEGGSEAAGRLARAARGAVFYSVPHFGSRLADWGWSLRYVGASPARAVAHLTTGPHLDELNDAVKAEAKAGHLAVLSLSEGQPMALGYVRTQVVPHESAYPGYGDFVVLEDHDHISICKPSSPEDPSYALLLAFLEERGAEVEREAAARRGAAADHMEAAL